MSDLTGEAAQRDPETYAIIGAALAVHHTLGHGFLETVYREALTLELLERRVPFLREHPLPVHYRGSLLPTHYRVDFVCYDRVIVELKALREITGAETAQVLNYLKASRLPKALLFNFGAPRLEFRRFVGAAQSSLSLDLSEPNPPNH